MKPVKVVSKYDPAHRTYVTALVNSNFKIVGKPLSSATDGGRERDVRSLRRQLPQRQVELRVSGEEPHQIYQATVKECDGAVLAILEKDSRGALAREVYMYNASLPQEI